MALPAALLLERYEQLLTRSPLSENTRRAYAGQAKRFVGWLQDQGEGTGPLWDPHLRDYAVRDYRRHLKQRKLAISSVNAHLAAVDHLCRAIGVGSPRVDRDRLPAQAPRALGEGELRSLVRAALRSDEPRDAALVALMALAGLRVSEVAALDVDDLSLSARKGRVVVRRGKGDAAREVPLSADARRLLAPWMDGRGAAAGPLMPGPTGRISVRALDRAVRRIAADAAVEASPHVLRHTFVTRLVRSGVDVVLAAELAGHRSLETTRRYSLPTEEDREAAVELVPVES